MLEFALALLATATVGVLLIPLLRAPRRSAGRLDGELAIYRDQLDEIERERAVGAIAESDAAAARLEIERRALAAGDQPATRLTIAPADNVLHKILSPALALAIPVLAIPAALLVGVFLGLLGSGGSILALPLLRLAAGLSFAAARATSFPVVGLAAAAALVGHLRTGAVRARDAAPFALASVPATFAASRLLAPRVSEPAQALLFAALMLVAAWRMARREPADAAPPRRRGARVAALVGALAGVLTGLLGIGGGFLIVPALVLTLGFDVRGAIATSLLVIVLNCAAGLGAELAGGGASIRWDLAAVFAAAGVAGAVAGRRLGARWSAIVLRRTFAVVVLLAAVALLAKSL